jgi:hypothetical protein
MRPDIVDLNVSFKYNVNIDICQMKMEIYANFTHSAKGVIKSCP